MKGLKLLYANVQSIKKQSLGNKSYTTQYDIDVACFQEVLTTKEDIDQQLCPEGFTIVPTINKNTSTGIGGGVLVIRKDNISMKEIGIVDKVYAQANICELKHDNIVITIKNMYRSPATASFYLYLHRN